MPVAVAQTFTNGCLKDAAMTLVGRTDDAGIAGMATARDRVFDEFLDSERSDRLVDHRGHAVHELPFHVLVSRRSPIGRRRVSAHKAYGPLSAASNPAFSSPSRDSIWRWPNRQSQDVDCFG